MKTQTYGITVVDPLEISKVYAWNPDGIDAVVWALTYAHKRKEDNWTAKYLAEAYTNYRANRENGNKEDSPSDRFTHNGKAELELQPDGKTYHVKYTEGPSDKAWMEARDRNYVFRLEKKGELDKLEPNLRTEVPHLYEEVMAYRKLYKNGGEKQMEALCIDHLKPHWFRKDYHLQNAGILLRFYANPNNVLLKLAADSDEIDSINQLFEIAAKHHVIIDRTTISEAINKANEKNYKKVAKFLQLILSNFQYQERKTQDILEKQASKKEGRKCQDHERHEKVCAEAEAKKQKTEEERKTIELRKKQERKRQEHEKQEKARAEAEAKNRKAEKSKPIEQKIETKSFDRSYLIAYTKLTFGRELGKGGFGTVYQGKWQCVDVAIKQLYLNNLSNESLEEFQSEAAMMAKLHHPNVVILYGVSIGQPGKYSLVMEYMPKGSLYATLHNKQPLDWNLRYRISMDIGAGLLHLHEQNILHRDLKSMNVLLDDRMRAKLSDFGLSKLRTETTTTATQVGAFTGAGTLPWMAPELFKRKGKDTKASDIYSLGMVFWEIASRLVPFADAKDPQQIIAWKKDGETEDMPEDCQPKYAELITWCWKEQTARPTINQTVKILEQMVAQNNQPSLLNTIYQSDSVYQQNSVNLAEENKSMPSYQVDTLSIKPQIG